MKLIIKRHVTPMVVLCVLLGASVASAEVVAQRATLRDFGHQASERNFFRDVHGFSMSPIAEEYAERPFSEH